jgi:hypothetical protein
MTHNTNNGSTRNARFWAYANGDYVKLTLRPDQALERNKTERTDEGWSATGERWTHCGDGIRLEWRDAGRDCDGRIERTGVQFCPLDRLAAHVVDCATPSFPEWKEAEPVEVFDEYARAANY